MFSQIFVLLYFPIRLHVFRNKVSDNAHILTFRFYSSACHAIFVQKFHVCMSLMVLLYLKHRIFFVCFVTYSINKPDSIIIVRVLFLYPSCEKQVNGNRIETAVILRIQSQIYKLAEKGFPFPLCKYYECK